MDKQHPNLQVLCSFLVLDGPFDTLSNQRPSVAFSQPFFTETFRKNFVPQLDKVQCDAASGFHKNMSDNVIRNVSDSQIAHQLADLA